MYHLLRSVGTAFPTEVWWRQDMHILLYILVLTTTVPGSWLLAYLCCACPIQQCMCCTNSTVLSNEITAGRANERTEWKVVRTGRAGWMAIKSLS